MARSLQIAEVFSSSAWTSVVVVSATLSHAFTAELEIRQARLDVVESCRADRIVLLWAVQAEVPLPS